MSVTLSCLTSCNLNEEELFCLPDIFTSVSRKFFSGKWEWYESGPPEPLSPETLEDLINKGFVWMEGPDNLMATPLKQSIEIDYGWNHSRFFTDEKAVLRYIDFCSEIAQKMDSNSIFFVTDALSKSYQQVDKMIKDGVLTVTDVANRLNEYCAHDVYIKNITPG